MLPDPPLLQDSQMKASSIEAEATDGDSIKASHPIPDIIHGDGNINSAGVYPSSLKRTKKRGSKMMNEADHGDSSPGTDDGGR